MNTDNRINPEINPYELRYRINSKINPLTPQLNREQHIQFNHETRIWANRKINPYEPRQQN